MEWQPMETAPKTGEGVLLYVPGYPGEVQAAVWSDTRSCWCLHGCESLAFPFKENGIEPEAWVNLLPPPK